MSKVNFVRLPSFSISSKARYIWVILALVTGLHSILRFTHDAYGHTTSIANILGQLGLNGTSAAPNTTNIHPATWVPPQADRSNAVLVVLARNSDLEGVVSSVRQLEDRFNSRYNYPWVFLNDEPFTEEFIRRVSILSHASMQFDQIPSEHWNQPDWIDEEKATAARNKMLQKNIIYGGSVSYRNMCRFNSGFFYRHELLKPYRYYWRVEPNVKYFCDINYDPFKTMEENNKTYGFTLSMLEYQETVPTLWKTVREFMEKNPQYISDDNSLRFLSDNNGATYNLCHFWSNFEIADMNFWRGEAYSAFFEYLDSLGGFYYERWGDAPVHSIAAALFAKKSELHFFGDIGYQHELFAHCPRGDQWADSQCSCNPADNFDYTFYSCLRRWERLFW